MNDDRDFDTIIAEESDGVYAWPAIPNENFKIREVLDYCRETGIKISEISNEDLDRFRRGQNECK